VPPPATDTTAPEPPPPPARTRRSPRRLDVALQARRRLIERLLAAAPHPQPDPAESARLLMAAHRAYLLDTFGGGLATRGARARATAALEAAWERLLG
jgi:hypothetical protein